MHVYNETIDIQLFV